MFISFIDNIHTICKNIKKINALFINLLILLKFILMLRSHTCGELRIKNKGDEVILCGWIQKIRDKGKIIWVDLRDRYGITQLLFEEGVTSNDTYILSLIHI